MDLPRDHKRYCKSKGIGWPYIRLHAASGNVSVQAQSAALNLTAKQAVDLQSTQASVHISAPQRLTLNGAGSYLLIDGGNIELGTNGPAQFKAAAKELTGGGNASGQGLTLPMAPELPGRFSTQLDVLNMVALTNGPERLSYTAHMPDGSLVRGHTDAQGLCARLGNDQGGIVKILIGEDDWAIHIDVDEPIDN